MKTALVTGAFSDIGFAITLALGAEGYKIICQQTNIKSTRDDEKENILKDKGVEYSIIEGDFSTTRGVTEFIQALSGEAEIDTVVHCAAQIDKKLTHLQEEEIFSIISHVNVYAPIAITKAIIERVRRSENPSVVFISSTYVSHFGSVKNICYSSTKAALPTISGIFAREYHPVRFNTITPGYVDTETYRLDRTDDRIEHDKSASLIRRLVKPEEVADAVRFVTNNKSVNASDIRVDGGILV